MPESGAPQERQSRRFMGLYALAAAGGAMAYVPFLTILLPVRVAALAPGELVSWLAYITFFGASSAALSNIAFGWLSDRIGGRRLLIVAGLGLSSALLIAMPLATTLPVLIAMIVAWQIALNMMLAPLSAWAGDCVPDRQKGLLGGLLAFAPAMGALTGALVTLPGLAGPDMRLVIVTGMVAACVLPAVILGRPRSFPELMAHGQRADHRSGDSADRSRTVLYMWFARLLVQTAEAALFAYLYVWFRSISDRISDSDAAQIFSMVLLAAVPAALLVGRWADRRDRPILPLAIAAGVSAAALLGMGLAQSLAAALFGYVAFSLAASLFLSLHSAQTLRVLPRPQHRGRDLGVFNLTNTVPSIIMPGLTLAMVPVFGFSGLFMVLAGLTLLAGLLLASVARPSLRPE